MNDEELERNKRLAQKEYVEFLDKLTQEETIVMERLKAEGKMPGGLDGPEPEELAEFSERHKKKIIELKKKYGFLKED